MKTLSRNGHGILNEIKSELDMARVKLTRQYTIHDSAPKASLDHSQEQCQEDSPDCPVAGKFQEYVEETKLIRQEIIYLQKECQAYIERVEKLSIYEEWYETIEAIQAQKLSARSQSPRFNPPIDCQGPWYMAPFSQPSNAAAPKTESVPVPSPWHFEGPWNQVKTHLEANYTGEHYSTPRQDTSVDVNNLTPPASDPALQNQLPRPPYENYPHVETGEKQTQNNGPDNRAPFGPMPGHWGPLPNDHLSMNAFGHGWNNYLHY